MFAGIKWLPISDLGVSQIYLSADKLDNVRAWFNPADLTGFDPLTVCDFGNGRLTLTDGHSRAFIAYTMGVSELPVVYDTDILVTSDIGQLLYKNDIVWCERFGVKTIGDLRERIISKTDYEELWIKRCDKAYNLLTQTTQEQRVNLQRLCPELYLFGANADVSLLFFESLDGQSICVSK